MAKTQNTARVLPTGEEPLKGFEQLYAARKRNKGLRVERVSATQLSSLEIRELERLRSIAIANVQRALNRNERPIDFSFEREMNIWPEGKSPTDKLTFRAFDEGFLRGYALVVRGWPSGDAWTIQHLIIDPSCRLQGIGAHIVQAIEDDALSTTESTRFIDAVPVSSNNLGFWEYSGYASIGDQVKIAISDYEFSFQRYRKAIR